MQEDVFLVVTDLHDTEKNLAARVDYKAEINLVYRQLFQLIRKYKGEGCKVHLMLLGDVFHRSYRSPEKSMESLDTVQFLCGCVDSAYAVVGNHEITWAASNPFWYLVQSLEDAPSLAEVTKKLEAKGLVGRLKVVDRLEFGNAEFLFNHYGTRVKQPERGKISIGLFHQDVILRDLIKEMEKKYGVRIYDHGFSYVEDADNLDGYQYAFVGHQHLSYGTYTYSSERTGAQTDVYWLASLGRTSETEVRDNFLERNIPAVRFRDSVFLGVEDNKFLLAGRAECVNEKAVLKGREYRKTLKERKNLTTLRFTHDPLENLKKNFEGKAVLVDLIQRYAEGAECDLEVFVRNRYDEVVRK